MNKQYDPDPDLKLQLRIAKDCVILSRKWRDDMSWDKLTTYYTQSCPHFDSGRTSFIHVHIMEDIAAEMARGYYLAEVVYDE